MARKVIAALVAMPALCVFACGAYLATRAMHPARRAVAQVCPCISHVACRDAEVEPGLSGWYFAPDRMNGGAVLMLHGVGATREDMVALSAVLERAGYAVLAPDLRGWGRSAGLVTFGANEAPDVRRWVDWMLRQPGVSRVYGFGVSLGASVLLESLDDEKRFGAVVAEAAYTDFPAVAEERTGRLLPVGLQWTAPAFVDSGLLWARLRYGANLWHGSAVDSARRTQTPLLIIHGLSDVATLPDHSRRIAAANPHAQLWLIPNAGHAEAWHTAGKEFERRLLDFYAAH